ncbi:nucleoside hydrolase [Mesorhizobium microcysteis]|uniref:Nucleoside hydrolase n=1 Tax=Neoaquamicrobium microcysteis TaxID=2682781 RepID=A0A5D4GMW1_9HYPH|nr:nucleoside hydrolase [Mesorhizobium microcysteis]TYR29687.1 nucleoside hydrolase [Mesorhizobium microcysteis]
MSDQIIRAVIDTDPGIDDAVAILHALSSPAFEIVGITTVAGNIGIETTTRNAGRILALAGRSDIPVVAGATAPLSRKGFDTADIHGNDGLGGVSFPEPAVPPLFDAVEWLADLLMREPEASIDILALGPLTNIARLATDHPEAARRMRRLIAMGGAIDEPGNVGPKAEFNIAADPEAAAIVFAAGLRTVLIPLDVTRKVRATRDYTAALQDAGTVAAAASGELIDAYFQTTTGGESRPLHDPCVMLYTERPDLFVIERLPIVVDLGDAPDGGALFVEEGEGSTIDVAIKVDGAKALELLATRLSGR